MRNLTNLFQAITLALIPFSLAARGDALDDRLLDKVEQIHRQDIPRIHELKANHQAAQKGQKKPDTARERKEKGPEASANHSSSVLMGRTNGRSSTPIETAKLSGKERTASNHVKQKGGHKAPTPPKKH